MSELVTLFKKPKLYKPTFIAAWPGMGNVAMLAVDYLKRKLGAELMGEMDPADFFAPTGATVAKQIIRAPEAPVNQFFYHNSSTQNDILFFIGSVQPVPHREHAFAVEILKVAQKFGAGSVFTTAAAPSDMHFKDTPRVFAVPNHPDILAKLTEYKVHFMSDGTIAGLNGLLIGVAAGLGIQGTCLLGEIPFFTAQMEFPRAAVMVLQILNEILGIKIDMVDLELYAIEKDKEIEPLAAMLSKDQQEGVQNTENPIVPDQQEEPAVSRSVSLKIEKLFRQAEFDRTYKSKMRLKEELDKWGLFDDYLDRFLDLFKKTQGEV